MVNGAPRLCWLGPTEVVVYTPVILFDYYYERSMAYARWMLFVATTVQEYYFIARTYSCRLSCSQITDGWHPKLCVLPICK